MSFWIAVWLFVFASGMLIATLANREERRKNRGMSLFMLGLMICAAAIILLR
ncbi:MAG: hypothetical protein ACPHTD_06085 [Gammaproteobacteria bacterium]|jgi:hypothetical protein